MGNVQTFGFWKSVSLVVPAVLFLALSWILAQQVQRISFSLPSATPAQFEIETVIVAPRTYSYRRSGKYQFRNTQVVAPMVEVMPNGSIEIMKYGVTADFFALCVADDPSAVYGRNPRSTRFISAGVPLHSPDSYRDSYRL